MKELGIGAALGIAIFGGWMAFQGGASLGVATPSGGFEYESATLADRTAWLEKYAVPMAKQVNRSLPKGDGTQPHMSVTETRVDARRRAIEIVVQVKGVYGIQREQVSAAKQAMVAQACPGYAKSVIGQNRVQVLHTFLGKEGREELSFILSPVVCREFMG